MSIYYGNILYCNSLTGIPTHKNFQSFTHSVHPLVLLEFHIVMNKSARSSVKDVAIVLQK